MRTIKVTGRGTLSIAPDTMSLGISLTGTDEDYAKAMEQSSQEAPRFPHRASWLIKRAPGVC